MKPEVFPPTREELRSQLRRQREALSGEERKAFSAAACARLLGSERWRDAAVVGLYIAVRGETDCEALMVDAWEKGKTVLLPRCERGKAGEMRLVACTGPERLRPGLFSIPEPVEEPLCFASTSPAPELILVPGLGFDRQGNRLGMGGGYYDRLLAQPLYANSLRIGFAYSFQVLPRLPAREWDMPVQALCTDDFYIRTCTHE